MLSVSPFTKKQAEELANLVNLNKLLCLLLCSLAVILGLYKHHPDLCLGPHVGLSLRCISVPRFPLFWEDIGHIGLEPTPMTST